MSDWPMSDRGRTENPQPRKVRLVSTTAPEGRTPETRCEPFLVSVSVRKYDDIWDAIDWGCEGRSYSTQRIERVNGRWQADIRVSGAVFH